MFLTKNLLNIISKTPLCSIDILINIKNKYLFGLRNNKRVIILFQVVEVFKNEDYNKTILRILKKELGLKFRNIKYSIIGIYNHFYKYRVIV